VEEEEELQRRSSARAQHPPCLALALALARRRGFSPAAMDVADVGMADGLARAVAVAPVAVAVHVATVLYRRRLELK
jgi:hypothetical protein